MLKVYTYAKCSTCRRAVKWLEAAGLAFEVVPIREQPPARAELLRVLRATGGELRRLFNTSGRDYRERGLSAKLPRLTPDEAFALLTRNGNLVKRPVLIGPGVALAGFSESAWKSALRR